LKSRTRTKNGEKVQCCFEYDVDCISIYVKFGNVVRIRYVDNKGLSEYEVSNRLLKLFYQLLEADIPNIESILGVEIDKDSIKDKQGNQASTILL
jgi:hypothetical protein